MKTRWPQWIMVDPVNGSATRVVSVQGRGKATTIWIGPRDNSLPDAAELILEGQFLRGFAETLLRALDGKPT